MKDLIDFISAREDCSNDLQKPAEKMVPVISGLIEELSANGASLARMTGSGSAVFGIYSDGASADKAYEAIRKAHETDGAQVFRLKTI